MEEALATYRSNATNKARFVSLYQDMMKLRCQQYLDPENANQIPAYRMAVLDFLAGNIQAKEVLFKGAKLNGVFLIPHGEWGGVLFSVDEPGFFHVSHIRESYTSYMGRTKYIDFSSFAKTQDFRKWVFNKIPSYKVVEYKDASFAGKLEQRIRTIVPDDNVRIERPITFIASKNQDDLANKLFDGLMERLDSDIDYLVFSSYEQKVQHAMEVGKAILMLATMALNVAVPGTGTLLCRIGLALANLAMDATYVGMAATQAQLADRPEDAAAFRNEAIIAGILGAAGTAASATGLTQEGITAARQLYRQAKFASGNIIPSALSRVNWIKLNSGKKIDVLVDTVKESQSARQLASLTKPTVVMQSMRRNLELDAEGAAKRSFNWNDFSIEQTRAEQRLTSDLARLENANKHMRRILDVPPVVSRDLLPGKPEEEAARWIVSKKGDAPQGGEFHTRITQALSDNKDAKLLDIDIIDRIYNTIYPSEAGQAARTFRSSSDPKLIGSDIARAGFQKALDEIKLKVDAGGVQAGPALYAAVMRYRPYVDGNEEIARTLYALEQLKRKESTFKSLTSAAEHLLGTEDVSLVPPRAQPGEAVDMVGREFLFHAAAPAETLALANLSAWNNPVRRAARDLMASGSNSGVCWDYATDVLKKSEILSESSAAALARDFKTASQGGGTIDAVLHDKREIANLEGLINTEPGELVVFMRDEKPVHAMVCMGQGKFAGAKNDYLDPRLGSSPEIITAEEMGVTSRPGGEVALNFSGTKEQPHKIYVGYPRSAEASKIPSANIGEANPTRLQTLLGPDSSINVVAGAHMDVRVHGAPYIINYMDASEFYHAIRGYALRPESGVVLDRIQKIRLQSCFGAWGGERSSAQILANRSQKTVEAYPFWVKARKLNEPDWWARKKKTFNPQSGSALDDMVANRKHMAHHDLWARLLKLKAAVSRSGRSAGIETNIDNLLRPIARLCKSDCTIDEFTRDVPSFSVSRDYLKEIVPPQSTARPEIGDDEFMERCLDVIMCNESAYGRIDAFIREMGESARVSVEPATT
ncbi:hypothetical protein WL22_27645 [Burkholderia ubonensis]|nr:hypothetical protein WL22_27645 [Burkholderia ubonensis]